MAIFFLCGCGVNTKEYYFKLEDFCTPKVYIYKCEQDSLFNQYRIMSSNLENNSLNTTILDFDKKIEEYYEEKFDNTGSHLNLYKAALYTEYEKLFGERQITESTYMLWDVNSPFTYSFETNYNDEISSKRIIQSYEGNEPLQIMNKEYECIKLRAVHRYIGNNSSYEFINYYGKHVGLVRIDFIPKDGDPIIIELEEIIPLEDWKWNYKVLDIKSL